MDIKFVLNGESVTVKADPMQSLLYTLRHQLGAISAKEGCDEGECGACSILMNDQLVNACLIPISQVAGAKLMTLEGLKKDPKGMLVIESLLKAKGVQCGFCTPGMVLALYALLVENPHPSETEIRTAISGNLCRCTGYGMIVDAARIAAEKGAGLW